MARGTWNIYTSDNYGDDWDADGTIYRPNESLSLDVFSTQNKLKLANGDFSFITPETRSNKELITMRWLEIEYDDAFSTKIRDYITNHSYCKIVDHNAEEYIGRFIRIRRVWLSGRIDTYDIESDFEQME